MNQKNRMMFQMFEWYLPGDGKNWNRFRQKAYELADAGVTMVWMPPAYKGMGGMNDVGYGVYDIYDLGEFDQKGTIPTKYGTKDEYLKAIRAFHDHGVQVLADIVLNHKMGADGPEEVEGYEVAYDNRDFKMSDQIHATAFTQFNFDGRGDAYSPFKWNHNHFKSVDYTERDGQGRNGIFLFEGKNWARDVDNENGNFDYLMGADIDLENPEVREELIRFGKWYYHFADLDGFRLDAVKHMSAGFYKDWIQEIRDFSGEEAFTVAEFWSGDLGKLRNYIHQTEGKINLFDVPLHMNFANISNANGQFDMAKLFDNTLTGVDSWHAVTFVDNHDTQPGQALGTWVSDWFKPIAYAIILLQEKGIPCVFYGDYYGVNEPGHEVKPVAQLNTLMKLRKTHAHGMQHDYYDHFDVVGFTREGENEANGLALLCSDGPEGSKWMEVGKHHAGQYFVDALNPDLGRVQINQDGWGEFRVRGGNVSVWIPSQKAVIEVKIGLKQIFGVVKKIGQWIFNNKKHK